VTLRATFGVLGGGIFEEWMVFNEFEVMQQIHRE
jgi:hypothetical protein